MFYLLVGRDSGRTKFCGTRSRSRTRETQKGVGVGRDKNSREPTALVTTRIDFCFFQNYRFCMSFQSCLFFDDIEFAQKFFIKVEEQCSKAGLNINAKTTEFMRFNQDHTSVRNINGSELVKVDDFRYLCSQINDKRKDINCRIGLAWAACNQLT